jgi:SAM-dependent methyltransferase
MNPEQLHSAEMFDLHTRDVPEKIKQSVSRHLKFEDAVVLDFGCDLGAKTYGFAKLTKAKKVIGVDINDNFVNLPSIVAYHGGSLPGNLDFIRIPPGGLIAELRKVDFIYSWSVFEHIHESMLGSILRDLNQALVAGGIFFVQVNPLYLSPYGSHLSHVIRSPWAHLLMSEDELQSRLIRQNSLSEQAINGLWNCYRSLNKLTLGTLVSLFEAAGFLMIDLLIGKSNLDPPQSLLQQYSKTDLLSEGFRAVLRKV